MCEARIIEFDEGAVFVAATEVTPQKARSMQIAARFLTGNATHLEPVDGCLFLQLTDRFDKGLFFTYSSVDEGATVQLTPEELVAEVFPEDAVINGLLAAVVLDPSV